MAIFKWLYSHLGGAGADYAGWQNAYPQLQAVQDTAQYTTDQAIQISTVYSCVDRLCSTMASLPCEVFLLDEQGHKTPDRLCNLSYIFQNSPSYALTPYEFIALMTQQWALRGNAYALITRKTDKTVKSLTPLSPDQMEVYQESNGHLTYRYYNRNSEYIDYKPEQILHWKMNLGNGIVGLSKLEYMRASLNEAVNSQSTAVELYRTHGKQGGILTSDVPLNNKQKNEVSEQFSKARRGGIPVINANLHFQALSLTPEQTQLLQTRKFGVEEICRWFGVPPALVQNDGGDTGSVDEALQLFYKTTILPMCVSLEQAIMKRVPCADERFNHVVRFRLSALNRANDKDRASINAQLVQNGIKTRNEIRLEEGLPTIEGADDLTAQNNLQPLKNLGSADASQTPQTPLTQEPVRQ